MIEDRLNRLNHVDCLNRYDSTSTRQRIVPVESVERHLISRTNEMVLVVLLIDSMADEVVYSPLINGPALMIPSNFNNCIPIYFRHRIFASLCTYLYLSIFTFPSLYSYLAGSTCFAELSWESQTVVALFKDTSPINDSRLKVQDPR